MVIAKENMQTHTEQQLDKETMKDLISPLQVWIARWDSQTPGFMSLEVYF